MTDIDYSTMRSIADEKHWDQFVQRVGGESIAPLIKREGVKNADYMFRNAKVIAELKELKTEFVRPDDRKKIESAISEYSVMPRRITEEEFGREIFNVLRKPLQNIINKANRQIKETKSELGLDGWSGILICVNDNFRGVPPNFVTATIARILSGTSYKSITGVIYQTNHYVELVENDLANLIWTPMYSENAPDHLFEFVNDLGRNWRKFVDEVEGPFEESSEAKDINWLNASVVTGTTRNKRFEV